MDYILVTKTEHVKTVIFTIIIIIIDIGSVNLIT